MSGINGEVIVIAIVLILLISVVLYLVPGVFSDRLSNRKSKTKEHHLTDTYQKVPAHPHSRSVRAPMARSSNNYSRASRSPNLSSTQSNVLELSDRQFTWFANVLEQSQSATSKYLAKSNEVVRSAEELRIEVAAIKIRMSELNASTEKVLQGHKSVVANCHRMESRIVELEGRTESSGDDANDAEWLVDLEVMYGKTVDMALIRAQARLLSELCRVESQNRLLFLNLIVELGVSIFGPSGKIEPALGEKIANWVIGRVGWIRIEIPSINDGFFREMHALPSGATGVRDQTLITGIRCWGVKETKKSSFHQKPIVEVDSRP